MLVALRARRRSGAAPPNRQDGNKIGLAVEGGGMRGVVSGAMLCALEDLGLPAAAFDAVYGCSSGATNGAYFIAGASWYPLSIYYDDLTTREFVDFRRAFTGDILNLNYVFESVLELTKPLRYEAVLAARTGLAGSCSTPWPSWTGSGCDTATCPRRTSSWRLVRGPRTARSS